jgi:hypothetical protein
VGHTAGPAAVTIVARNYLPFARTLFASMAAQEPSVDRYVFVVDIGEEPVGLLEQRDQRRGGRGRHD